MQNPNQIYCPVRKQWVASLPEEMIRQRLVLHLTENLGFPLAHIALEKELRHMPHLDLKDQQLPDRRADIICFAKDIHPKHALYPLLLIECKAVKLTSKVINQIVGYNHYMQAYFIAIVNEQEIKTGWYDPKLRDYTFIDWLPSHAELMAAISRMDSRT
jgi:hypothetical protein